MKRANPSEPCRIKRFAIVDFFWTENAPATFMRQKLAVFSFLVPKNGGTQDGLMHSVCPGCDRAVCCWRSGSFRSLLWRLPLRATKRALRRLNFKFCLEHIFTPYSCTTSTYSKRFKDKVRHSRAAQNDFELICTMPSGIYVLRANVEIIVNRVFGDFANVLTRICVGVRVLQT